MECSAILQAHIVDSAYQGGGPGSNGADSFNGFEYDFVNLLAMLLFPSVNMLF